MDSARKVIAVVAESMLEVVMKVIPTISPMCTIVETKKDFPKGMIEAAEVAGLPYSVGGVEVIEPQGLAIPASIAYPTEIQAEMALPAPLSSSAASSFRIVVEFLRGHLAPVDRWVLDGKGTQHQMAGAFRFLALISPYLANFAWAIFGSSPLKLIEVKEELERFKYYLE